ncbi:MAG TPA: TIM barrel protein, partial [Thermomicrobiales bacterium]|nr:TIM barrel protein [Thermomicrobiales bacterium]
MESTVESSIEKASLIVGMPKLVCSTGAISRFTDLNDHQGFIDRSLQLHADAIEVMIFDRWYERLDEIAADFRAAGIRVVATHAEKNLGPHLAQDDPEFVAQTLARFSENCRFTHLLGGDRTVLHLWGLPESDKVLDRMLAMLPELVDRAAEHHLYLGVESIPCVVADPLTNLQRVLEAEPRSKVTLDTEFLAMHGQVDAVLSADWLWDRDAVVHLHVKDFIDPSNIDPSKRTYLHPGEGEIDFAGL